MDGISPSPLPEAVSDPVRQVMVHVTPVTGSPSEIDGSISLMNLSSNAPERQG